MKSLTHNAISVSCRSRHSAITLSTHTLLQMIEVAIKLIRKHSDFPTDASYLSYIDDVHTNYPGVDTWMSVRRHDSLTTGRNH